MQKITDQQLISSFLEGNSSSIERLIIRHKDKAFGFIISKVKDVDVANDLFQEVFIKVINKLKEGRYNEEGKFLSWLLRISHNMVIDHFRKKSRTKMIRSTEDHDVFSKIREEEICSESESIKKQVFKDLRSLITHLSEDQRVVLEMRYYSGMSFKEISEECNISINTALGRMRYALMNLRKLKQKHHINLAI